MTGAGSVVFAYDKAGDGKDVAGADCGGEALGKCGYETAEGTGAGASMRLEMAGEALARKGYFGGVEVTVAAVGCGLIGGCDGVIVIDRIGS